VAALVGGLLLACSDEPLPVEPGEEEQEEPTLSGLLVSQPITPPPDGVLAFDAAGEGAATDVAYVSLLPGTLSEALSVVIRNLNTNAVVGPTALFDGGFDPIAVSAAAGDRLELEFRDATGGTAVYYSTVPPRRPPTIVRTNPPKGRTDVALGVQPVLVFSEPLDPATITPENVRLLLNGAPVAGTVVALPDRPWIVQIAPAGGLQPLTVYTLDVRRGGVANTAGDTIELGWSVAFTTGAGPSQPLAAVVHVSVDPDLPPEGATVVGSLAEAMVRVEPGGRVVIYDGVHAVENVGIDRPVSFEAAPGSAPVIEVTDLGGDVSTRRGFNIAVQAGTVSFSGLTIEMPAGYAAILAQPADELLIDGVRFILGRDVTSALVAAGPAAATSLVTVRNVAVNGGMSGILANSGARVDVVASEFSDQGFANIQYQMHASGRIEGNTISECGIWGCIRAVAAEYVEIVGNHVATTDGRVTGYQQVAEKVRYGIAVSNGTHQSEPPLARALIENNTIEGLGGWMAITDAALLAAGFGRTEVVARGNIIRNALGGIGVGGPTELLGSDNRLETVYIAYIAGGGTLVDNYSDVVDYAIAVSVGGDATIDARCNWWGSAAGPGDITGGGSLAVLYEPWASAPVAGTGDRSCTP
jgi:hypothetical protein